MSVCETCQKCSWYSVIDICDGQANFNLKKCPIDVGSKAEPKGSKPLRDDTGMQPWGERKKVG